MLHCNIFKGISMFKNTPFEAIAKTMSESAPKFNPAAMQDAIKLRMSAMAERKARYERQEDAMRSLIISVMDRASLSKFVLPEATLSLRMVPPAPIVTDADLLTDDCVRIERKPDMKAIKALMESNGALPGVAMSNGRQSLTIRTK